MAGDWIKFESTTPDKPEVVAMASVLGIDQDAVVGKLMRLWVWADQNSVNGNGVTVTSSFLDRITFCPGFAKAMRDVGWLSGDDGAMSLPNFERHNGKTAKERAVTNRRVADHRIRNGESNAVVTPAPLPKPLPEKRRVREEKKEKIDMFPGVPPQILADWKAIRKLKKLAITQTAIDLITAEAAKAGMTLAQALTKAVEEGWGGFKAEWLTKTDRNGQPDRKEPAPLPRMQA